MAHWAEINLDNKVLRVLVTDNNDPNGDEGYLWLTQNLGGTWIKTSYNNNIRKQFAGIDFTYDAINDVFISPKPFDSWVLNSDFDWEAPVPKPEGNYIWDEPTLSWQLKEEL
jgi:hypothetical protein